MPQHPTRLLHQFSFHHRYQICSGSKSSSELLIRGAGFALSCPAGVPGGWEHLHQSHLTATQHTSKPQESSPTSLGKSGTHLGIV